MVIEKIPIVDKSVLCQYNQNMRKVFRNGNSLAVTVPKEYASKHKIQEGSLIDWNESEQGLVLSVEENVKPATLIDPEVAKLIQKISKKYSLVWQELAKL